MKTTTLASLSLCLALAFPAMATVLRVPLDQPDLPAALAAAAAGDTVRVAADHTVAGGVVVPDLGLDISGGWDATYTNRTQRTPVTAGPDAPSITVTGDGTRLAGFDITAGAGAELTDPVAGRYGGGVLVLGGDHHLFDLEITGGALGTGGELGAGGGLALIEAGGLVEQCTVRDNRATWGGGVFVLRGAPTLRLLEVDGNQCGPDAAGQQAQGAGIMVRSGNAVVDQCQISGGRGAARGGGLAWIGSRNQTLTVVDSQFTDNTMVQDGGGLYGQDGSLSVTGCTFEENLPAPDAPFASGGGAYVTGARMALDRCVFRHNAAAAGGGLTVNQGAEVTVTGSVFWSNDADLFGAALNYQTNQAGAISGNTLALNQSPVEYGVLNLVNASVPVDNNIVAFNGGGGVAVAGGAPTFACNDVVSNSGDDWSGVADPTGQDGNVALDPQFCDLAMGDLTLDLQSPCLDAAGCGLIGALGSGCGNEVSAPLPSSGLSVLAYPNPANPAVTLRFELASNGPVQLVIHDARGREVRRLVQGHVAAGPHQVRWDGADAAGRTMPSGVYLYRLQSLGGSSTGRLTLLR